MKKIIPVVFLVSFLFACRRDGLIMPDKKPLVDTVQSSGKGIPVTVVLDESAQRLTISDNFEGLSFETKILTKNPNVLNSNNQILIQLLKNLGPGLLRIGGNTSDEINWTGNTRNAYTGDSLLTTSDIDRLAAFANATGWPVLFGLNLGNNKVTDAVNETQYVYKRLGGNLYAIQAGNEPDIYNRFGLRASNYAYSDFHQDWRLYFNSVHTALPQAVFAGPDVANNLDYVTSFADDEGKNIRLIDAHFYLAGPASSSSITYHTLLTYSTKLWHYMAGLNTVSTAYHIPYRITETNNIYGGGKPGVSDVFVSALWALDMMWTVAVNRGQGINFHGGEGLSYSPIAIDGGFMIAMPEYYAMLAFKYGSTGKAIIPATITENQYNCSAYVTTDGGGSLYFTLINKEENKVFSFNIQVSKTISSVNVSRLSSPSITSPTGTTFAGATVSPNGSFTAGATGPVAFTTNKFTVDVPAGSAVVVKVN
jgi:hypothetical protein